MPDERTSDKSEIATFSEPVRFFKGSQILIDGFLGIRLMKLSGETNLDGSLHPNDTFFFICDKQIPIIREGVESKPKPRLSGIGSLHLGFKRYGNNAVLIGEDLRLRIQHVPRNNNDFRCCDLILQSTKLLDIIEVPQGSSLQGLVQTHSSK